MGRPTDFNQDLAISICEQLSEGISLNLICKQDGMPSRATALRWMAENTAFRDLAARAREAYADVVFDEAIDIADDGSRDEVEIMDANGEPTGRFRVDHDVIQRARLRVETRLRIASKLAPKKYGEKMQVDMTANVAVMDAGAVQAELAKLAQAAGIPEISISSILGEGTS